MKKYLFLATAIATASLFTGCSNNEYVGDQPEAFNGTDGAIVFSMGKANTTRAEPEPIGGEDAAKKLNGVFYVYGEKYTGTPETPQKVFDTYKVQYKAASSDKSASNTNGWEYVGIDWNSNERQNVAGEKATAITQTIKYWDYSADHYTFYAFSANPDEVTGSTPKIKVSAIENPSTTPSYTVSIENGAHIENLYFADKKVVSKPTTGTAANPTAEGEYGGYVQLKFRNLASKVRVGFYETVPGYKINITKMYGDQSSSEGAEKENTTNFIAECPNTVASQESKITVKYQSTGEAYVAAKNKTGEAGGGELSAANTLTLGAGVIGGPLETTSSSPTWDNGGKYTFFWPQTGNSGEQGKPLKIKVDYTLTSTDGSNEEINVTGATATVPKEYVAWKANTAYTYIFKISDNTNGTTGSGSDPKGLYPITFDAVVEDYANEGSVTTVSTPSVTASQQGATDGYVSANGIVFQIDTPIDLKVMKDNTDITTASGTTIEGKWVANYDYDNTPDQNVGNTWEDLTTQLTQPVAGYYVLRVKYTEEGGSTSTTYVIIRVGNAEKEPANP